MAYQAQLTVVGERLLLGLRLAHGRVRGVLDEEGLGLGVVARLALLRRRTVVLLRHVGVAVAEHHD